MFLRALVAFLALPGMVAFAIPAGWLWLTGRLHVVHPPGLVLLLLGTIGLLWCVRDFYVRGKGTLAPWSPPERLVVLGLYRWTRNPMYVSVATILLGWATAFAATGLYVYTACVVLAVHLRVVFGEEPWLAKAHGAEWDDYVRRVPRWFF